MLNFNMLKPCGAIIRKLGVKEFLEEYKNIDMEQQDAQEQLGYKTVELLCENLESCADDILKLCAAYKSVTVEEMAMQDPIAVISELLQEEGLRNFIKPLIEREALKKS